MCVIRVLLLALFLSSFDCILCEINITAYRQMPPLYSFDEYDKCLDYDNVANATYCMVFAEIMPNATSPLWQQIVTYSSYYNNFRHDQFYFGVCFHRCQHLVSSLNLPHITHNKIMNSTIIDFHNKVHKPDIVDHELYEAVIENCLNYEFQRKYNLKLHTNIAYCNTHNNKNGMQSKHGALDYIVYAILICIAVAVIFCSIYDARLKEKQSFHEQTDNFYKSHLSSKVQQLLTTFSICRNYNRIMQPPKSELQIDLRFFEAIRAVSIAMVIYTHTIVVLYNIPTHNPQFIESAYDGAQMYLVKYTTTMVHIFFLMTSFLFYIQFNANNMITPKTNLFRCVGVFFKVTFLRYLRLVPSLVFIILFQATIYQRIHDGPFWRHLAEHERVLSHDYWWKNILFINNLIPEFNALPHTWYIAADMQLFIFFLVVLIVMAKYPMLKKSILSILVIASIAIPTLITIYYKTDAIFNMSPELFRHFYFTGLAVLVNYVPFYTNMSGYLAGIIAADIYLRLKRFKKIKQCRGFINHELTFYGISLMFLITVGIVGTIMSRNFGKPRMELSLISGLYRPIWNILCVMIILPMCFKVKWFAYKVCCLPMFRPLGKISFQAYLWNFTIIPIVVGYYRQPIYLSLFHQIFVFIVAYLLIHVLSFILALIIEFPLAVLVNLFFAKSKENETKISNGERNSMQIDELKRSP